MKRHWIKFEEVVALEEVNEKETKVILKGGYAITVEGPFEEIKKKLMEMLKKEA